MGFAGSKKKECNVALSVNNSKLMFICWGGGLLGGGLVLLYMDQLFLSSMSFTRFSRKLILMGIYMA